MYFYSVICLILELGDLATASSHGPPPLGLARRRRGEGGAPGATAGIYLPLLRARLPGLPTVRYYLSLLSSNTN